MINKCSEWEKEHGSLTSIAYTHIFPSDNNPIIISTVIIAAGHKFMGGFFQTFETKIFGAKKEIPPIRLNVDISEQSMAVAIEQHISVIKELIKW
jgi:hypothetical protein